MDSKILAKLDIYIALKGSKCLFCGSKNIKAQDSITSEEDGTAHQLIKCLNCEQYWTDIYTLTRVTIDD